MRGAGVVLDRVRLGGAVACVSQRSWEMPEGVVGLEHPWDASKRPPSPAPPAEAVKHARTVSELQLADVIRQSCPAQRSQDDPQAGRPGRLGPAASALRSLAALREPLAESYAALDSGGGPRTRATPS